MWSEWQLLLPALTALNGLNIFVNPLAALFAKAFMQAGIDLDRLLVKTHDKAQFIASNIERNLILIGKFRLIKGTVEILTENVAKPLVHVIAGHIEDVTESLELLDVKSRNFH